MISTPVTGSTSSTGVSGTVSVVHRPEQHRYELHVDDRVRGLAVYSDDGDVRAFVHTEIDGPLQGNGLAAELVRVALDEARTDHRRVLPACPYVEWYIETHREWAGLLAS